MRIQLKIILLTIKSVMALHNNLKFLNNNQKKISLKNSINHKLAKLKNKSFKKNSSNKIMDSNKNRIVRMERKIFPKKEIIKNQSIMKSMIQEFRINRLWMKIQRKKIKLMNLITRHLILNRKEKNNKNLEIIN